VSHPNPHTATDDNTRPGNRSTATAFGHAIVIGAGISGLFTARVLADHFRQVSIVERDPACSAREYRSGTPQARHPHALLARGRQIAEELFPGLGAELSAAGAPVFDFGERGPILYPSGLSPRFTAGIPVQTFTRPLFEAALTARVRSQHGVTIHNGCQVTGLSGANRVTGVTIVPHADRGAHGVGTILEADLVVDASGRYTRLPDWLVQLGLPRPQDKVVDPRLGYATRIYRIPDDSPIDWLAMIESLQAPALSRGCFAIRGEDNQLIFTLQGAGGDLPPGNENGFMQFAQSLRSGLADVLEQLPSLSPICCYRSTTNRWTAYHHLPRWPDGLIAIGDSVCAFNPIYGQGMTVAAQEALLLREMLERRAARDAGLAGFSTCFLHRQAKVVRRPWLLNTAVDRGWQDISKPTLLTSGVQWFMDNWFATIPDNPAMSKRFMKIMSMLSGPETLLLPPSLARIIATAARRRTRTTQPARVAMHHLTADLSEPITESPGQTAPSHTDYSSRSS
jgi:2-polyprenyl-6-methoxyphenol hydroxylase-like FAD-dependent oxidoreductase